MISLYVSILYKLMLKDLVSIPNIDDYAMMGHITCTGLNNQQCLSMVFSRGHATLHLAVSVGMLVGPSVRRSVTFLNSGWFLHYCSCPTVRDWIAVYPALFYFIVCLPFHYCLFVQLFLIFCLSACPSIKLFVFFFFVYICSPD